MKFNDKAKVETVTNHMGSKAYKQTPKEELVFASLTTFIESSYYESKDNRLIRIKELVAKVAKDDPSFVAKLALYARQEFNMRSIFPVLVGELSKHHKGTTLVRQTVALGAVRVDDLIELASYLGANKMSSAVKRGIADAFNKFDSYQLAKYKSESKEITLVDLVNLVHPKANNTKTAEALSKLIKGELKNTDTWEAQMSSGKSARDTFSDLMDSNRLGYMALLRNLRNIVKTGDFNLVNKAASFISDESKVRRSKQLPFRFLSAYQALDEMSSDAELTNLVFEKDFDSVNLLKKAVDSALLVSVQNIPLLTVEP